MDSEGKQLMIYKHAVSTISPAKAVFFTFSDKQKEQTED
jgi:sRNA-binding regulator protein Hfq